MRFPYSLSYGVDDTPVSVIGSPPPTSFTAPVTFDYTRSTGWVKFVGSDVIRSSSAIFINAIPLITDRYNSGSGGTPYETGDSVDLAHATMIDIYADGDVGGVMGGDLNTLPSEVTSQFGGHIPGYVLEGSAVVDLTSYIRILLATKPVNIFVPPPGAPSGFDLTLGDNTIHSNKSGDLTLNHLTLTSGSRAVLIVTDQDGALADVTFNDNIDLSADTSLMVIARNIRLANTVSVADAVFVSTGSFETGSGNTPLKIMGNIVALGGMVQGRVRGDLDHARPSVLVVFDPSAYIRLMPMLSTKENQYTIIE